MENETDLIIYSTEMTFRDERNAYFVSVNIRSKTMRVIISLIVFC